MKTKTKGNQKKKQQLLLLSRLEFIISASFKTPLFFSSKS